MLEPRHKKMSPRFAEIAVLASSIAMILIRAPHGARSGSVEVAKSYKGALESCLLTLAWAGFLTPFVWMATPLLAFADYPLRVGPFSAGIVFLVVGLWLFHRSHADLGTNWSVTLEMRRQHELITRGVYRYVRHPMYLSILIYSFGQALVLPNWIAGPAYAVMMVLLFAFRLGPEEKMMLEAFGPAYASYAGRTRRLFPGVW
jgi:protein-S-isoprenylcysteine O-methyltransferase Ste14